MAKTQPSMAFKTKMNQLNTSSLLDAGNKRAKKQSKLGVESEFHDPNKAFEVLVGGKTDASIFFDNTHARHAEEQEFDRLYGAREGRKFRIGHSVEV